jgi:phage terminase Nu1 subunit (DNA packaging protein)
MDDELRALARRRGMPDVELIREACARELGRTQARDEMTELRKEVQELKNAVTKNTTVLTKLTSAIASLQRDPQLLLQRRPPAR